MQKRAISLAWNTGLSRETDERFEKSCEKMSSTIKEQYENGREPWMKGKKHSDETKEKLSKTASEDFATGKRKINVPNSVNNKLEHFFLQLL